MRRHARVDVLSIVTFNYWFRERDANRQILFIDIHKCSFYNDRTAISVPKSIVSDSYHSGIVESRVFAAEEIAEGIADEVGVASHLVGGMMGMAVRPCGDSTVGYVVTKFGSVRRVQDIAHISLFEY